VLERLKERGERGIVYDFKGDYVSRFYNPDTDILFNPWTGDASAGAFSMKLPLPWILTPLPIV